jgi:allophanate hydrolase
MTIGNVRLQDGRRVKGFLCEEYVTHKASPISAHGGWRNFLDFNAAQNAPAPQSAGH